MKLGPKVGIGHDCVVTLNNADTNDDIHDCVVTLHDAYIDNLLRTPHNESMDLSDEFYLSTGYEPNAYDFKETSVEPCTELLDSPPFFSNKGFPVDAE